MQKAKSTSKKYNAHCLLSLQVLKLLALSLFSGHPRIIVTPLEGPNGINITLV